MLPIGKPNKETNMVQLLITLALTAQADLTKTVNFRGFSANYFQLETVRIDIPNNKTEVVFQLFKDEAAKNAHIAEVPTVLSYQSCLLVGAVFLIKSALITKIIAECPIFAGAIKK